MPRARTWNAASFASPPTKAFGASELQRSSIGTPSASGRIR